MSITTDDIKKLANLSRIKISEEEMSQFAKEIEGILGYVEQIKEVSDASIVSTSGTSVAGGANTDTLGAKKILTHKNAMREDVEDREVNPDPSILVKIAPESQDGYVKVKKILG